MPQAKFEATELKPVILSASYNLMKEMDLNENGINKYLGKCTE
jgi:hypothetical protein